MTKDDALLSTAHLSPIRNYNFSKFNCSSILSRHDKEIGKIGRNQFIADSLLLFMEGAKNRLTIFVFNCSKVNQEWKLDLCRLSRKKDRERGIGKMLR
jgi:hypothetical protein